MNTKSFRSTLKEIATGLFAHDQVQLRNSIVRVASALGAVYAEGQKEHMRNASLAVKYLVLQNKWDHTKPKVVVMAGDWFDELGDTRGETVKKYVTDTLVGQPAQYKGMALTTEVENATAATSDQKLLQLWHARRDSISGSLELVPAGYVLASSDEFIDIGAMSPLWVIDAITA
jgi:hypothetical protein